MSAPARRLADLASIPRDWIAYWLVMVIPGWWGGPWDWAFSALLPYAGGWAWRSDPWVKACREHWIKTGEHLNADVRGRP